MKCKCPACGEEFEQEYEEIEEEPQMEEEGMKVIDVGVKEVPDDKTEDIKNKLKELGKLLSSIS